VHKQLLVGTVAAAILAAAVAGGSYASLASGRHGNGDSSMGTLKIELTDKGGSPLTAWGKIGPLQPGDPDETQVRKSVVVKNSGTTSGKLYYRAVITDNLEGECTPPEQEAENDPTCGAKGELSSQLSVLVEKLKVASGGTCSIAVEMSEEPMYLDKLAASDQGGGIELQPAKTACLRFSFYLDEKVDNRVQGDITNFQMSFSLKSL